MAKKVTVIILSVILAAVVGAGSFYYFNSDSDDNSTKPDETFATHEVYLDDDKSEQEYIVDETQAQENDETQYSDAFIPSDDNLSDNTVDVVTTNFTIERIVDHTTNEEVSGRVVFGKSFNQAENYIAFDSGGNFEINLSGYLDQPRKGTYTEYDNIIYVEFEDGKAAEYTVNYTDDGTISYIVVNYGDYDVYFS